MDKEQNILETQLILGKQVLEIIFDLLKDKTKAWIFVLGSATIQNLRLKHCC